MKLHSIAVATLVLLVMAAHAQPTAFTYQGRLNDGTNPATGLYDLRFQIYNGSSVVVAGPQTNAVTGVTNGMFLVTLDFGAMVFDGDTRSLEIAVRASGNTNAFTVLAPRQPFTSTPYAIQSINASNAVHLTGPLAATNLSGTIADARLSSNVALLSSNQIFTGANTFNGVVTASNAANVFSGTFRGNGAALTNLAGTNLVGTVPDARLSANVALLSSNQVFTGVLAANNAANTFSGTFTGDGSALTSLTAGNLTGTVPDARLSANVALQSNTNLNFAGTINAVLFTGSGHGLTNVPGAFFWVTVTGTNVQAQSNVGYILTNNLVPVNITLPPTPSVGDVFRVAGVGAAGWKVVQNANQYVLAGNFSDGIGANWKTNAPSTNWTGIASSADGTKLVAVVTSGRIYTSADSGASWTPHDSSRLWSAAASSVDGTKLMTTVGDTVTTGQIYTSTDSGATWTARTTSPAQLQWVACASSADGSKLVATAYNGNIYTSTDSGASWTARDSSRFWVAVASSADGTKLVAAVNSGQLYTSTNSGVTWTNRDSNRAWSAVASSADGNRLVATVNGGQIYTSIDSGVTWTAQSLSTSVAWRAVTSSADGSRLAAVYGTSGSPGYIYTSADSGTTWLQRTEATAKAWAAITSSADGSKLAAVAGGGFISLSAQGNSTAGTGGSLVGGPQSAMDIIYVGNGIFMPLSHEGTIRAY